MEALIRSSNMIFSSKTLSPPRTLLGRSGFHFLSSPISSNNLRFLHSVPFRNKAIQSNLSYQTEALTGLEGGANRIQGPQPWKTVHVRFQLQKECSYGENFLLVGDDPIIGSWDPSRAKPLNWSDGHIWTLELDMPINLPIQYKFILKQNDEEVLWQPGPDRILRTWDTKNTIVIAEDWESAEFQKISEMQMDRNANQGPNMGLEQIVVPVVNDDSMFGNNFAAYDHDRKSEFTSITEEESLMKNANTEATMSMETKEQIIADIEKGGPFMVSEDPKIEVDD